MNLNNKELMDLVQQLRYTGATVTVNLQVPDVDLTPGQRKDRDTPVVEVVPSSEESTEKVPYGAYAGNAPDTKELYRGWGVLCGVHQNSGMLYTKGGYIVRYVPDRAGWALQEPRKSGYPRCEVAFLTNSLTLAACLHIFERGFNILGAP